MSMPKYTHRCAMRLIQNNQNIRAYCTHYRGDDTCALARRAQDSSPASRRFDSDKPEGCHAFLSGAPATCLDLESSLADSASVHAIGVVISCTRPAYTNPLVRFENALVNAFAYSQTNLVHWIIDNWNDSQGGRLTSWILTQKDIAEITLNATDATVTLRLAQGEAFHIQAGEPVGELVSASHVENSEDHLQNFLALRDGMRD
jgi:hypothetical protein